MRAPTDKEILQGQEQHLADKDKALLARTRASAGQRCASCKTRKLYTGKGRGVHQAPRLSDSCNFCYTEAGWENEHQDDAHQQGMQGSVEGCWICFPELNLAAKDRDTARAPRVGTSRVGMRLTVSIRAAAKTKAQEVKAQLPEGYKVTIRTDKDGITRLTAKGAITIHLAWDGNAFASGTVQATNGTARKVRNASEALRHAGV